MTPSFPHRRLCAARVNSVVKSSALSTKPPYLTQLLATLANNIFGINKVRVPGSLPVLQSQLPQHQTGFVKKRLGFLQLTGRWSLVPSVENLIIEVLGVLPDFPQSCLTIPKMKQKASFVPGRITACCHGATTAAPVGHARYENTTTAVPSSITPNYLVC